MKTIVVAGAMLAGIVFAAVPVIDPASISARQDGGHTVVIGYTMNPATDGDTDPAIITVDVLTNYTENAEVKWASIGGEHLTTLRRDAQHGRGASKEALCQYCSALRGSARAWRKHHRQLQVGVDANRS